MKCRRFTALLLAVIMLFSMTALAAEPHATGTNTAVDGVASSVVTVDAEPAQMTVTVPAILPATVNSYGSVSVATDAKIVNHSYGPIAITAIQAEAISPWTLVGNDFNFASAKVGAKQIQLTVAGSVADASGNIAMDANWIIAGGDAERAFTYEVKIPAQKAAITAEPVKAVFTVDWDLAEGATEVPLEGLTISGPTTVSAGESITLTAVKVPSNTTDENTVTWSSSNDNIATVNNDGVVAGVANGSVTITATCGTVASTWAVEVVTPELLADHAILYSDGTLVFQHGNEPDASHGTVVGDYTGFDTAFYEWTVTPPWYDNKLSITVVEFSDTTKPVSTATWFSECANLASVDGLELLDTSNVKEMYGMFMDCAALTSLDLSGFDTSKVTDMSMMFTNCNNLTTLTLGPNFAFKGTFHGLRDVPWYDIATGTQYTATTIPSNKAATYTTLAITGVDSIEFNSHPALAISDGSTGWEWSSSDPSVLTIDSAGDLYTKDTGTATITARKDGVALTKSITVTWDKNSFVNSLSSYTSSTEVASLSNGQTAYYGSFSYYGQNLGCNISGSATSGGIVSLEMKIGIPPSAIDSVTLDSESLVFADGVWKTRSPASGGYGYLSIQL